MESVFLILVVFVYTVSASSVSQNETEIPVPVSVKRRQTNDFYNATEACDVTYSYYLVSDRQCVQNQTLFNSKSNNLQFTYITCHNLNS